MFSLNTICSRNTLIKIALGWQFLKLHVNCAFCFLVKKHNLFGQNTHQMVNDNVQFFYKKNQARVGAVFKVN